VVARQGSVEAEFVASARRYAAPVRGIGLVLIGVFGLLAVPEEATPLGLALFGLVLAGAAVDCWAKPQAVILTFAIARAAALCATQEWTDGEQWALNSLTTTAITLFWEWSPKVAIPVTAALLTIQLTITGEGILRLALECALARLAYLLLRRSSRRVDELRAKQAALKREEAVAQERRAQEREYLALLHDTASTTFLLVAIHGQHTEPERVAEYARHDLSVLTERHDSPVDLRTSLQAVVDRSPLTVDVRWRGNAPVPAKVALALVRAVREALANVERHAGIPTATIDIDVDGQVIVADTGNGFQPEDVPSSRRGLRGSVVERMAAAGGSATVTSSPGAGTTVRLEWPHG
jgi:signal transduction histidine kinase